MGLLKTLGLRPKTNAKEDAKREAADARTDVDAILSQITALVLGGIDDDSARKAVNAELGKLKASFAKAEKIANPKASTAAFNALLGPAQALLARADGAKNAEEWMQANVTPLVAPAQSGIDAMAAAPKAVLQKELDSLKADTRRYAGAGDTSALQTIILPRLKKLHALVTSLPKVSTQADADIATAAKVLMALDHAQASELLARLAALKDQKASTWPGGTSLDEMAVSVDAVSTGAKALIVDGEALKTRHALDRDIAALRARLDALKPRIDKAAEAPVPPYIELRQNNVKRFAQVMDEQLTSRHRPEAQKTLETLVSALDDMERFKGLLAAYRAKLQAAKNGPIKAALAVKLAPPDLAASRDKAINTREQEIEAMTADGVFGPAMRAIDRWIVDAGAWSSAKEAYDSLHSKDAKTGRLEDLADRKGGASVLDTLVADLPPNTPPKVLITALKARYGVKVEQFTKLKRDKTGSTTWDIDESTKIDPTKPDPTQEVDLEGLYKVLSKVPVKDVKNVERIKRVTQDQKSGVFRGGVFTDTIDQRVYHEAYEGVWVSYKYAARAKGITGYQFRAPAEWFAELYAAFHMGKLNRTHPAFQWLSKLKAQSASG